MFQRWLFVVVLSVFALQFVCCKPETDCVKSRANTSSEERDSNEVVKIEQISINELKEMPNGINVIFPASNKVSRNPELNVSNFESINVTTTDSVAANRTDSDEQWRKKVERLQMRLEVVNFQVKLELMALIFMMVVFLVYGNACLRCLQFFGYCLCHWHDDANQHPFVPLADSDKLFA